MSEFVRMNVVLLLMWEVIVEKVYGRVHVETERGLTRNSGLNVSLVSDYA